MPHIRLEYTSNLKNELEFKPLFTEINAIVHQTVNVDLSSCMSGAVQFDDYVMGDGAEKNALLHVEVALLSGRPKSVLNDMGTAILNCLNRFSSANLKKFSVKTNVKLIEIPRELYFK